MKDYQKYERAMNLKLNVYKLPNHGSLWVQKLSKWSRDPTLLNKIFGKPMTIPTQLDPYPNIAGCQYPYWAR
jgi:hypothetical protein